MKSTTKLMWIIANTCGSPLLQGYDAAFIELWSHGKNQLRNYIIVGEGNFWFPSVESGAVQAKPIGKLLLAVESDCDAESRSRIIDFLNLSGKKVVVIGVNNEDKEL
jgi:hypothetical protein